MRRRVRYAKCEGYCHTTTNAAVVFMVRWGGGGVPRDASPAAAWSFSASTTGCERGSNGNTTTCGRCLMARRWVLRAAPSLTEPSANRLLSELALPGLVSRHQVQIF